MLHNHPLAEQITIRLFNPFPLQHQTMLLFFAMAKHNQFPVLITGDQSLGETISLGAPFIYQICRWKSTVAEQLLVLCQQQGYDKLAAFLTKTFMGETLYQGLFHADNNYDALIAMTRDNQLYQEFEQLPKQAHSLNEKCASLVGFFTKKGRKTKPLNYPTMGIEPDTSPVGQRVIKSGSFLIEPNSQSNTPKFLSIP